MGGIFLNHLKKLDWGIIISSVLLVCFGLGGIFSASAAKDDFLNLEKQIIFFVIGFLLMIAISFFDYRLLRNNSYLILILYGLCFILLLGLQFFAPVIRGTKGWYKVGILSLDPIEPAKIILVVLLAKYFSMRHVEMYKFRHIVFSGLYVFMLAFLVFIKPDLGGTMILVLIWLGILFISGIRINHFLILLLCLILAAALSWNFLLQDYQRGRVISFMFPQDPLGGSWSQEQAKIAIGSGRILGEGLAKGSQVQYGFLPESHTDFIFSTIYGFLVWRVLKIAIDSQYNFPRLFASGTAIILIVQFFINIGMNLSLLPVVGIYLPLISYGGSGLIFTFIALGI